MSAVFKLFDFHQFLFPLHHQHGDTTTLRIMREDCGGMVLGLINFQGSVEEGGGQCSGAPPPVTAVISTFI